MPRVIIVDALRGFALLGIILIHSIEHFDFFYPPDFHFLFPEAWDHYVFDTIFILISGKAYSIFALMFGFSFFIQMERQKQKGIDFRGKFAWRLIILMVFGFIHSLFYEGDILHIYAILGLSLLLIDRLKTPHLLLLAILLALQIPLLIHLSSSLIFPDYQYQETFGAGLWSVGAEVFAKGSFYDVLSYNIWKGRSAAWGWTFYNGRYLQLMALFVMGLYLGRKQFFQKIIDRKKTLQKVTMIMIVIAVAFYILRISIPQMNLNEQQSYFLNVIIASYSSLTFTFMIFSIFSLLYISYINARIFNYLAVYGRMSLTNYVMQSIIGVILFYGYGFGLYRYLGSSWSLIYGLVFFLIQVSFSHYWMKNYYYGPLEWLWRALTQLDFSIPLKRKTNYSKI